ncbi:DUF4124 domain-containing protein [Luteibacter aegosomatis]|uniref:DUF4124 domain-containing protein n=1 Tax=Luteibacter aegosomatis TaxID=2911537 RepID=UPI001FF870F7|nr:DUF4124 domain-containing protein [Luteibacter aegosomatis]UPG85419.1 DUF4124 domain-containing protein [Luteibacter aegosomatis]
MRLAVVPWLLLAAPAAAETVYKCQANGQVTYQQAPCATHQAQQVIRLQDAAPSVAPPVAAAPPTREEATAIPAPPPVVAPLPRLFACVRATDGKPYTSDNGNPQPYLAPFGVLGAATGPLSANVPAASAPELTRGVDFASATRGHYVWVQDTCRELSAAETCEALRDEAEANQRAIRNAFKSERGPLDAKDARLRGQLQSCR